MKRLMIIGRPAVGKTLFLINFAAHMGQKTLRLVIERPDHRVESVVLAPEEARARLVGRTGHFTRSVQSLVLDLRKGKARVQVELEDTPGLDLGIHPDAEVRKGMAQTIRKMRAADLVIHIVDALQLAASPDAGSPSIDMEIAHFALTRGGYIILVNKMDIPGAQAGLEKARALFPGQLMVGISALTGLNFRQVARVVGRYA
ncbi:MAG: GTPase [Bacillota bacterium]|nr:GTPase [Bacillota bacterium]